jgi:ribonuclease BN (tRNA processing enzyme)
MPGGRAASGYRLSYAGETLHLDFGPGNLLRLAQAGEEGYEVERILFSHYHIDHHADLLPLLFLRYNEELRPRLRPLRLYGPKGLRRIHRAWVELYGAWVDEELLEIKEFESQAEAMRIGAFEVQAFQALHSLPAFCYRIRMGSKLLAYSGDSGLCSGLIEACRDVDYAVLECSFVEPGPGHLCPSEIQNLIDQAGPKRVGLSHFYPEMAHRLPGELPDEGTRFASLGLESRVDLLQDLAPRTL